jgi:hypothetical protein
MDLKKAKKTVRMNNDEFFDHVLNMGQIYVLVVTSEDQKYILQTPVNSINRGVAQ